MRSMLRWQRAMAPLNATAECRRSEGSEAGGVGCIRDLFLTALDDGGPMMLDQVTLIVLAGVA